MNRKPRLLLVLLVAIIAITAASVLINNRAAERRREKAAQEQSVESRDALKKGAQLLKPDIKSDLRFGKSKSPATPLATPTPTTSP